MSHGQPEKGETGSLLRRAIEDNQTAYLEADVGVNGGTEDDDQGRRLSAYYSSYAGREEQLRRKIRIS